MHEIINCVCAAVHRPAATPTSGPRRTGYQEPDVEQQPTRTKTDTFWRTSETHPDSEKKLLRNPGVTAAGSSITEDRRTDPSRRTQDPELSMSSTETLENPSGTRPDQDQDRTSRTSTGPDQDQDQDQTSRTGTSQRGGAAGEMIRR